MDKLILIEEKINAILKKLDYLIDKDNNTYFLTKQETADVLRVSVARVNQLIASKKLNTTSKAGRVLISKKNIYDYLLSPSTKAHNYNNLKKN